MKNQFIQLVPADVSLAQAAADYYQRNRDFLKEFEPERSEEFFSPEYQRQVLREEMLAFQAKTAFRFYIVPTEEPDKIIGIIGLNNVVWGAFRSAFLGYKLDREFLNRGYMSMAVEMLTGYAFRELCLHRIEGNVMPKNRASLRVLEKNRFVNEGLSRHYLKINGVWEDHIHMVKINDDMHDAESGGGFEMRKCIRCGAEMKENCYPKIAASWPVDVVKDNLYNGRTLGRLCCAVCSRCGYVEFYMEDTGKLQKNLQKR